MASTFFLDNFGTAKHIVVAGLYVHDVNGINGNGDNAKDNGGIIFPHQWPDHAEPL